MQLPPLPLELRYDAVPGAPWRHSDLVRCVLAPNPGPYTFTGTNTYLVGEGEIAVIDPGPDDDAHLAALLAAIGTAQVTHILVTHTHRDHSPLAAKLSTLTGAPTFAYGPHPKPRFSLRSSGEEGGDLDFEPDQLLFDGDSVNGDGWTIQALYTPGHIQNHLCFELLDESLLFTGDHIMGWSTSVIGPADGDLGDFYDSCERLLRRHERVYLSAHGAPILRPRELVAAILEHRRLRDGQILDAVAAGADDLPAIVAIVYPDLEPALQRGAKGTVLSHLLRFVALGTVAMEAEPGPDARFALT